MEKKLDDAFSTQACVFRADKLKEVQDQLEIEVEQEFTGGWQAVDQFEVMYKSC